MALALHAQAVHGQTSDTGSRLPDLLVTRLQEPATRGPGNDQVAPARSAAESPLPATSLDERQPGASLDGPRRISMTVARPMPLADLLLLLVNGTPFSLVDGEAAPGATFIGDLKDLTMRQAIEAVLFPRSLDYDVQGTLIRVFPRKMSTRLFNVNYPNTRRNLQRQIPVASSIAGQQNPSPILLSSSQSDLFDDIEKGVQSLLSSSGRMHVDRTAGLVQATDFADRLDQIGVYVEAVQLRAARQVRIDADVFEVRFTEGSASSIDWSAPSIRSAAAVRSAPGSAQTLGPSADTKALKKAIAEQGVIAPIGSPQVLAMNNEPALIRLGDTLTGGLTLAVVAQISADGIVQMHVSPSYSTRAGQSTSSDGAVIAAAGIGAADTLLRVQDGETVVFSGFLHERETGSASATNTNQPVQPIRSELVILLTPTIVRLAAASPH